MKPRHRARGVNFSSSPETAGLSSSGAFRIEARAGHAWFARSEASRLPAARHSEMLPALRKAELILANQGRAIARRARRVPSEAIVALGAALGTQKAEHRLDRRPGAVANDNSNRVDPKTRMLLREIVFLIIFGATLAGTYYLGRMHGFHNVIVVPDSKSQTNRLA